MIAMISEQGARNVDAIYYRDGVSSRLAMHILRRARTSIFNLFMREMRPDASSRILDIGVSDDENEGANFLEKLYPWQHNITCAGIGDGKAIAKAYPQLRFQRIEPGERLPFPDGHFDIACSNAVIEHVGGREQRQAFITEHLRVARAVFITFPNRWFPFEHHTGIPLLHYVPSLFRKIVSATRLHYWAHQQNMDFLDRAAIRHDWPQGARQPDAIMMTGLALGPLSSNIAVIVRGRDLKSR